MSYKHLNILAKSETYKRSRNEDQVSRTEQYFSELWDALMALEGFIVFVMRKRILALERITSEVCEAGRMDRSLIDVFLISVPS